MKRALILIPLLLSCLPLSPALLEAQSAPSAPSTTWVSGYYPLWAAGGMPPSSMNYDGLTHIIHFCASPSRTAPYLDILVPDANGDKARKALELGEGWVWGKTIQADLIKYAHQNGTKVLLSLGGIWGQGASDMAYVASDPVRVQTFVTAALDYARSKGYDGIELDWEFPNVEADFTRLITLCRQGLDQWPTRGLLAAAVNRSHMKVYNAAAMNANIDQIYLMMYDYYWTPSYFGHPCTGYNAPLHKPDPKFTELQYTSTYETEGPDSWIKAGVQGSLLGLGVPFYGYVYRDKTAPGQTNPGNPFYVTEYNFFADFIAAGGVEQWDDYAKVPWISGTATKNVSWFVTAGQSFYVTFDNPRSLREKILWGKSKGTGGIMIYDLFSGWNRNVTTGPKDVLLRALVDAIRNSAPADATAPTVSISAPLTGATVASSPVTVTGISSDNVGVTSVSYSNAANGAAGTATGTTSFSASVPLASGSNVITVTARDAAGNTKTASVTVTLSSVTPPPPASGDILIYRDALASDWTNASWNSTVNFAGTSPIYSGTRSAGNTTTLPWGGLSLRRSASITNPSSYSAVEFYAHGGATAETLYVLLENNGSVSGFIQTNAGTTTVNAWKRFSIPMSTLNPVGQSFNRIHLQSNLADSFTIDEYRLVAAVPSDATKPVIAISSPTAGSTVLSSPITVSGSASDNVGVSSVTYSNAANGATGTATGTTAWSFSVALAAGSNVITVTARDAAGNTQSASVTITYSVDVLPPVLSVATLNLSVSGSASDDRSVSSVTWRNAANGATGTASGTTTWSASIPVVSGSNAITFTARDAAGNIRTSSITITYSAP